MSSLGGVVSFSDIQLIAQAIPYSGDSFELELSAVSLQFQENGIPTAKLKIALGESPQQGGGVRTAKAHLRAGDLERRDRIVVTARLKGHQRPDKQWEKGGSFDVFIGYLGRPAYTMGVGAASLILEVDHWLSDLATTNKLSYTIAAGSVAQCTRPALVDSFSGGQACFDGRKPVYADGAPDDIWGAIKDLFRFLADKDRMEANLIFKLGVTDPALVKNTLALQALGFMDTGKTMTMAMTQATQALRERIREGLCSLIASEDSGSSYWETLITASKEFMFSVVPTIATATCAPVVKTYSPGISKGDYRYIEAAEYDQIQAGGEVRALPIRALGLYSSCVWFTLDTAGLSQKEYQVNRDLIGYWDLAKDGSGHPETLAGQLLVSTAPVWMHDSGADFAACTPTNTPTFQSIRTAANAKSGGTPPNGDSINKKEDQVIDKNNPERVGNQLARMVLSDVSWCNRTGSISGRLRFDIAPGTPVAVEIVGKNVPLYRAGRDNVLHAHVYQVDIDIDAINARASTTLHLSHMRTSAEEEKFKSIVMTSHPLYGEAWNGTSLLDGQ